MTSSKQEMAQCTQSKPLLVFFSLLLLPAECYMKPKEKIAPALLAYPQNFDPEGERSSRVRHTGENIW